MQIHVWKYHTVSQTQHSLNSDEMPHFTIEFLAWKRQGFFILKERHQYYIV